MPLLAKITPARCTHCEWKGEMFFCQREGWKAPCPDCGRLLIPDERRTERTHGNRRFGNSDGVSQKHGFHPNEVPLAQKLMPRSRDNIRPDGTVHFPDSHAEKTFRRELTAAKGRLGVPESEF